MRVSGIRAPRWLQTIPTFWCACPCPDVIPSHWVWAGLNDWLLMRQKCQYVIWKPGHKRQSDMWIISHWGKHLPCQAALWKAPMVRNWGLLPTAPGVSLEAGPPAPLKSSESRPITPWETSYEKQSGKPILDSCPSETVWYNKYLLF